MGISWRVRKLSLLIHSTKIFWKCVDNITNEWHDIIVGVNFILDESKMVLLDWTFSLLVWENIFPFFVYSGKNIENLLFKYIYEPAITHRSIEMTLSIEESFPIYFIQKIFFLFIFQNFHTMSSDIIFQLNWWRFFKFMIVVFCYFPFFWGHFSLCQLAMESFFHQFVDLDNKLPFGKCRGNNTDSNYSVYTFKCEKFSKMWIITFSLYAVVVVGFWNINRWYKYIEKVFYDLKPTNSMRARNFQFRISEYTHTHIQMPAWQTFFCQVVWINCREQRQSRIYNVSPNAPQTHVLTIFQFNLLLLTDQFCVLNWQLFCYFK